MLGQSGPLILPLGLHVDVAAGAAPIPRLSSWAGTQIALVSIRGPWGGQSLGTGIHVHIRKCAESAAVSVAESAAAAALGQLLRLRSGARVCAHDSSALVQVTQT